MGGEESQRFKTCDLHSIKLNGEDTTEKARKIDFRIYFSSVSQNEIYREFLTQFLLLISISFSSFSFS